jgi:hypothetical protein
MANKVQGLPTSNENRDKRKTPKTIVYVCSKSQKPRPSSKRHAFKKITQEAEYQERLMKDSKRKRSKDTHD